MSEKKISKEEAEKQAKEYFTAEYGITNYDYTEWFDVFSDTTLKDDNDDEVFDCIRPDLSDDHVITVKCLYGFTEMLPGLIRYFIGNIESPSVHSF